MQGNVIYFSSWKQCVNTRIFKNSRAESAKSAEGNAQFAGKSQSIRSSVILYELQSLNIISKNYAKAGREQRIIKLRSALCALRDLCERSSSLPSQLSKVNDVALTSTSELLHLLSSIPKAREFLKNPCFSVDFFSIIPNA